MAGFDTTMPFTVFISGSAGPPIPITPIRVESNGAIVVAAPLHIDSLTGQTSTWTPTISVTQGKVTVSSQVSIGDIPQLTDYGVTLGAITRAFYNHQEITLGASINAQQAISALAGSSLKNSSLLAHLNTQLQNVILARSDIDRVVTKNSLSIPIGTATDGTAFAFGMNSVALMDRIIGQYLLAYSSTSTTPAVRGDHPLAVSPTGMQAILQSIVGLGGAVSFKQQQQTATEANSSTMDNVLATLSTADTAVTIGAGLLTIGAVVLGAPEIAVAAGAVATYSALAGVLIGSAAVGNDLYNVATNAYGWATEPRKWFCCTDCRKECNGTGWLDTGFRLNFDLPQCGGRSWACKPKHHRASGQFRHRWALCTDD